MDLSGPAASPHHHGVPARIALVLATAALISAVIVVARTATDVVLFAVTVPIFLSPGIPLARWYAGATADRLTHLTLAALFGLVAGSVMFCALRAVGVASPMVVLAACAALAVGLTAAVRTPAGVVRLARLTPADAVALGCLLLLVAAIVGPVFARIGADTPQGKAYRAYFIADLFGFMSVVGELVKGHTPPLNPYNAGEALPYYWTYFAYPAIYASLRGTHVPLERGILLTQIVTAAALASVWYLVVRNLGRSIAASFWTWTFILVASSFEGLAWVAWSLWHQRPVDGFRYVNVDGLTRWWWSLPPVDGMHRALWYTPQHAASFTCGFVTLMTLTCARDANGWRRRVADGLLLGAAFLLSSLTGILLVVSYAITECIMLLRARGRDAIRWLASCAIAAAVVLVCVGLAYALRMIQPIEGGLIVHLDRYLLAGPWRFVALSFGPALLLAVVGVRRFWRDGRDAAIGMGVLVTVCTIALLGLEAPGHDNTYLPLRTGNFFFLALAVTLAFAFDEVRSWRGLRRSAGFALATLVFVSAVPTVALDWYNARDIHNTAMNPGGFPWTVHESRAEQAAMRWMRETLPLDAIVQTDAQVRGRASWALIPAFGQRRMAAGIVLFEPNPRRLDRNLSEVRRVFSAGDAGDLAHARCLELGIDYVYVGDVEADKNAETIQKFAHDPDHFRLAYTNAEVKIYQVLR